MSKRYHKFILEDITSTNCTKNLETALIQLYESAVKQIAVTNAHIAIFETSDFFMAAENEISGFNLTIKKQIIHDQTQYCGTFIKGDIKAEMIASLEKY